MQPASMDSEASGQVFTTNRPGQARRERRIGALRYVLPLVLVGLAVHLILPQLATLQRSWQVLRSMVWWAVLLAVAAQVMSYMGSGYLLRSLVAAAGQQLSAAMGSVIYTAAASVGLVAGGSMGNASATFRWVQGCGAGPEGALLAAWLPGPFYTIAVVCAALFGLVHLLIAHQLSTLQLLGFGLTLLTLIATVLIVLWGLRRRAQLTELVVEVMRRWSKLRRQPYDRQNTDVAVGRFFGALGALRQGGWQGAAQGAALNIGFDMLTLFLLFLAARHPISLGTLLVGYGLPLLLTRVTFLPGGVGLVESTMVALYTGLGVPDAVAVVVILSYRFLSFWLPLVLGFPMASYLQRVCGKRADRDQGRGHDLA